MSSAGRRVAVRLDIEGAEEVRAGLIKLGADGEAALKRLNFDTSSTSGAKLFNAALQESGTVAAGYATQLGPLGGILTSLGGGWLAAAGAAGAFAIGTYKAVEAADAQAESQARVNAILKATGDASGLTAEQVEEMAARISGATLNTRDAVRDAAAELLTFRNIGADVFERTLTLATDMSAVFKTDLATSALQLGRALDDPIAGMNSLRRAGLDLSAAQKEIIANFERSGDLADAQKALLDALAEKLGGAAGAQHGGVAGAAHDASEAWHDMLVEIGQTSGVAQGAQGFLDGIAGTLRAITAAAKDPDLAKVFDATGGLGGFELATPAPAALQADRTKTGLPAQVPGDIFGINAAAERHDATSQALEDAAKQLREQASGTTELQRSVNKVLDEAAKAQNLSVEALRKNFPHETADLTAAATADFNASHTKQTAEEAAKRAADLADQKQYLAQLTSGYDKAWAANDEAQDRALEYLLKGQEGYYAVAEQSIDTWSANQKKQIADELAAQIAALDKNKAEYAKDNVAFAGYQKALTTLQQTEEAKRAAIDAEAAQRKEALAREEQGALYDLIAKGNEDLNTSLKRVAADGLKGFETALLNLVGGSGKAGEAFKQMVASILQELAQLLIEKYIISQLASELNSLIDGIGGGGSGGGGSGGGGFLSAIGDVISSIFASADGNAFNAGNVIPFAYGGIIDRATVAPMALMGEAGPEAIMPLRRGADGKLGVAGAGSGGAYFHYQPIYNVGGKVSQEDLDAVRAAQEEDRARFAERVVTIYAEARSRRMIK